jgi:predicted nucleotidyltransferase
MNNNPLIQSLKKLCLFFDEQEIEYMLVGGLAVGIWGEPRATIDIDFLVSIKTEDFNLLKQKIEISKKFIFIHDEPMIVGKISFLRATLKSNKDISVDFLFADNDFKHAALKRKEPVQVADFSVNISTPEDLIILKLLSSRPQDRLDAKKVLEIQKEHLDRKYMQKWAERLGIDMKT